MSHDLTDEELAPISERIYKCLSPHSSKRGVNIDGTLARRLLAELIRRRKEESEAVGNSNWQLIESAPRDGTAVLVMRNIWPGTKSGAAEDCNGHNTYVAEWWACDDEGCEPGHWVCYMDAIQDPECPIEPTHWMSLPSPPIATQPPSDQ